MTRAESIEDVEGLRVRVGDRVEVVRGLYTGRVGLVSRIEGPYVLVGVSPDVVAVRASRIKGIPVTAADFAGALLEASAKLAKGHAAALELVALFFVLAGVDLKRIRTLAPVSFSPLEWTEVHVDGVRVHRQRWEPYTEGGGLAAVGLRLVQEWGPPGLAELEKRAKRGGPS